MILSPLNNTSTLDHCCMLLRFPGSSLQHWPLPALSLTAVGAALPKPHMCRCCCINCCWRSGMECQCSKACCGISRSPFRPRHRSSCISAAACVRSQMCCIHAAVAVSGTQPSADLGAPSHAVCMARHQLVWTQPSGQLHCCLTLICIGSRGLSEQLRSCPVTFDFCAHTKQGLATPATMRPGLSPMLGLHRCLEQTQRCLLC